MPVAKGHSVRVALRGLEDPARTLAEAVAEISANLEGQILCNGTSHPQREEIVERLARLRAALSEHGGSAAPAV